MAMDGQGHLLVLKVMRVSKPSLSAAWEPFFSASPSFSARATASLGSLQGSTPLEGHPKTLRDLTNVSPLLTLPSSFGTVQLGETFSSCLCLNNEANEDIEDVCLKVEMQTATSKVLLTDLGGVGHKLEVGAVLETIVQHEIKEVGQHVLACTIRYRVPQTNNLSLSPDTSDPTLRVFSKYYKFAATNPLSVKTKVHLPKSPSAQLALREREKVFLEIHVQNLTQDALWFESMEFQPVDGLYGQDTNALAEKGRLSVGGRESLSKMDMLLQPKDVRQYVYVIAPVTLSRFPPQYPPGSVVPLGRLDISWRSSFGEPGRLLTSMLSRKVPTVSIPAMNPHLQRIQSPGPLSPQIEPIRPGSPFSFRVSNKGTMQTVSPSVPVLSSGVEVDLAVTSSAQQVAVGEEFDITFSLAARTPRSRASQRGEIVRFAIQHTQPPKPAPSIPKQIVSALTTLRTHDSFISNDNHDNGLDNTGTLLQRATLPAPYDDSLPTSTSLKVDFLGPSAFVLPPLQVNRLMTDGVGELHEWLDGEQDFKLRFVARQSGFVTIGGLRVFLIDEPEYKSREDASALQIKLLKKWDVIAELWVS